MADRQRLPHLAIAMDVLDGDDGDVHEEADREAQAAEGHDVERVPRRLEPDDRAGDRERDAGACDEHAPPAAEEDEDHERHEERRGEALDHDAADRGADEHGLVEIEVDLEAGRRDRANGGEHVLRRLHDRERGRVGLLQDRQVRRPAAVHANDVGLVGESIGDTPDIPDGDGRAVDDLDGNRPELGHRGRLEFNATLYSRVPMRAMPAGMNTFEFCTAVTSRPPRAPWPTAGPG